MRKYITASIYSQGIIIQWVWMITRGISVFEALPSTSGRRLSEKDLAAKQPYTQH